MSRAFRSFAYVLSSLLAKRSSNDPAALYLLLMLGQAVCFSLFFTVQLIYHVTVIGLDPIQLILIGTTLEVTCFAFEVPTGIVADVYSRRLSILIGIGLIGCAYLLEGSVAHFWAALAGQVFWGLGYTFTSGATQAWITDEIGEAAAGPIFLRGAQVGLIGGLLGTAASASLGLIYVQVPLVLAGVGMLGLTALLALTMPETHMRPLPPEERSTFAHVRETARDGFRLAMNRPVVKVLISISLITGLAAEAFDRLHVPSMINRFDFPSISGTDDPVVWFGISGVIGSLVGIGVSEVVKRRHGHMLEGGNPARLLAGCAGLQVVALLVFTLSGNLFLVFAMLWLRTGVRAISEPIEAAWMNRHLDPATRATVGSMSGQANSIGQVGGGLALGWIGQTVSIRAALVTSAFVLTPAVALYRRMANPAAAPQLPAAGHDELSREAGDIDPAFN